MGNPKATNLQAWRERRVLQLCPLAKAAIGIQEEASAMQALRGAGHNQTSV